MKINTKSKGLFLSYIYFIVNTILSIFISSFIIRAVGKTDYGVYQAMTAFISYLVLFEFGTATLMTRNISLHKKDGSDDEKIKKNISTIWSLTLFLTIIITISALFFYFFIPAIYGNSFTENELILGKKLFVLAEPLVL